MSEKVNLEDFLDRLASSAPAPGGGGAAAVTGALGAALVSMVANLTVGKKGYEEEQARFEQVRDKAENLRQEFIQLVSQDAKAFESIMEAYRLPKDTETEAKARKEALQNAFKSATEPPFRIAELNQQVLDLSLTAAARGNRQAITDAEGAAVLAEASIRTALLNVDINLNSIKDEKFVKEAQKRRSELEEQGKQRMRQVMNNSRGTDLGGDERLRLARKSLEEAKEYTSKDDPGQASKELYKATEECIKALTEYYDLSEIEEVKKQGQWWTKLLGRASKHLARILGKEEISNAWTDAFDLHVLGFHENGYTTEDVKPFIPEIEKLVTYVEEKLSEGG